MFLHKGSSLGTTPDLTCMGTETSQDHILQQSNSIINPLWILLDNQSTVDVFSNSKLLKHIHPIQSSLKIYSTGGVSITNTIGHLHGYGWVWYHPTGIANILSLARVKKLFPVTYNSGADNEFHLHLGDGRVRSF